MSASPDAQTLQDPAAGLVGQVPVKGARLQRFFAFLGPGYLVATGYMDPGNWATSLAAGSKFGATLLFVVVLSSLMAIVLQALTARLALASGRNLAELCRQEYPRALAFLLWLAAECAIVATDLAEVIGTAIGLELLFGLPLWAGVLLTALDAFLILALERLGFRKIEAFVVALVFLIAGAFAAQLALARPDMGAIAAGLAPTREVLTNPEMLYLAIGIIGATVMPHNLFLHSGLVHSRRIGADEKARREAIGFSIADSSLALGVALLVNASILILAASVFHRAGHHDVAELGQAHALIAPILGSALAAKLFALALIGCGLNSTVTATLAGQIVMDGFLNLRISPVLRRLVTRAIAITPAIGVTLWLGESATARLLVLSQVILSIALPFAVLPLIHFSAQRRLVGAWRASWPMLALGAAIAALIVLLNGKLLWDAIAG
jgi:manganese transport protein